MSENNQKPTRQDLHRNHKRNNLLVVLGIIAAAFLGLVLLYNIFYGNDEEPSVAGGNQTNSQKMIMTNRMIPAKRPHQLKNLRKKRKSAPMRSPIRIRRKFPPPTITSAQLTPAIGNRSARAKPANMSRISATAPLTATKSNKPLLQ